MYERSGFRVTSDLTAMITFFYAFMFTCVMTGGVATVTRRLIKADDEECKEGEEGQKRKKNKKKVYEKKDDDAISAGSESLMSSYLKSSTYESPDGHCSSSLPKSTFKRNKELVDVQSAASMMDGKSQHL